MEEEGDTNMHLHCTLGGGVGRTGDTIPELLG